MESILIPAAVAVIVFVALLLLVPKHIFSDTERRKRTVLGQVSQETQRSNIERDPTAVSLLKELPPGFGAFSKFPGVQSTVDLLLKSGLWPKRNTYFIATGVVFVVCFFLFHSLGGTSRLIFAALLAFWLPRKYLKGRIIKRNKQFLNLFPDAIEMIVRSVRSGHPINTALRMVADNMESPIKEEFKQVVDEVAYGRTMSSAIARLAQRIDENDINFFVVVLSVQQETGGSLAEVLANLSSIIRKRRQLFLKVRAITSEGRATSYVLGALPIIEGLLIWFISPDYFTPMFSSLTGLIILGVAAGLVVGAFMITRAMCNIDI